MYGGHEPEVQGVLGVLRVPHHLERLLHHKHCTGCLRIDPLEVLTAHWRALDKTSETTILRNHRLQFKTAKDKKQRDEVRSS